VVTLGKESPSLAILALAPKIKASLLQRIVILTARIDGPPDSVKLKDKASGIQISMAQVSSSALATEIVVRGSSFPPRNITIGFDPSPNHAGGSVDPAFSLNCDNHTRPGPASLEASVNFQPFEELVFFKVEGITSLHGKPCKGYIPVGPCPVAAIGKIEKPP